VAYLHEFYPLDVYADVVWKYERARICSLANMSITRRK
jgi:hypothetical protein